MRFHVLKPEGGRFGTKWAYGESAKPELLGAAYRCPVCQKPISMKRWLPPHYLQLSSAKPEKWGDFVWGTVFPLMVSSRFKAIYEQEGMKGITVFHPAATIVKLGNQKKGSLPQHLPEYHLIEIAWNAANLDDVASKAVRKRDDCAFCRGSLKSYDGIFLEKDSWDGSDIFEARGLPGRILISEKFKQMAEDHKFKNILLIPAEDYIYDEAIVPHRRVR
jgi:hypothetical protein